MAVVVELDVMLARRKMSVGDFADAVGITPANVAVLKNGRARAIRFTTLDAICRVLECQPGDILRWTADPPPLVVEERIRHAVPPRKRSEARRGR
jgi:putative transcriptional regulator